MSIEALAPDKSKVQRTLPSSLDHSISEFKLEESVRKWRTMRAGCRKLTGGVSGPHFALAPSYDCFSLLLM